MRLTPHTGANWRVELPDDWTWQRESDGIAYFESADRRRGLYIAVWDIQATQRTQQDVLDEFARVTIANQDSLPDHHWIHRTVPLGDGDLLIESVDAGRGYRVLTRVITRLPLVLRAAFHDYAFTTVPESNAHLGSALQTVLLT